MKECCLGEFRSVHEVREDEQVHRPRAEDLLERQILGLNWSSQRVQIDDRAIGPVLTHLNHFFIPSYLLGALRNRL